MAFWCPQCGDALKMTTPEDLECHCGFTSRKVKERTFEGAPVWTDSYRCLKKVYDWDPPVLLRSPSEESNPDFDPDLLPWSPYYGTGGEGKVAQGENAPVVDEHVSDLEPPQESEQVHPEPSEEPIDILGLTTKLSREILPAVDVNMILGELPRDARRMARFVRKAITFALSTSNPLVTGIVLAENIRRVKPNFLMTPRERGTMPRFMAKVLVGTTDYNLKAENEMEYRMLEEGTRFLFASEPPSPHRVFVEILNYDKGIASLAHRPQALLALYRICEVFFDCTLQFEDILEKVIGQLDTEIAYTNGEAAQCEPDQQSRLLRRNRAMQFYKAAIEVLRQGMAHKEPL